MSICFGYFVGYTRICNDHLAISWLKAFEISWFDPLVINMPLSAAAQAAIDRAKARKENLGLGAELGAQETMEQSQFHQFF